MKIKKILTCLLCAAMLTPVALFGSTVGAEGKTENGIFVDKTATYNVETNDYTITLEAYATGEKTITSGYKDVPTDIVLVLDQSGSMKENIGTVSFSKYTRNARRNSNLYNQRHNGGSANLWYQTSDGSYVSVSVTKTTTYTTISADTSNTKYYNNRNNLYEKVENEYKKVEITRDLIDWSFVYTYTFSDGFTVKSNGSDTVPDLGSHGPLYTPSDDVYTYTYTKDGVTTTIGNGTGANNNFGTDLYERVVNTSGGGTKVNALKNAVNTFLNQVSTKAKGEDGEAGTGDDVDHRVAIVGFASTGDSQNDYTNTELLSTQGVVNYRNASSNNYKDALVSVNGTSGNLNNRLTTAVTRLDTSGDTYLEYGMDMANKIFAQYDAGEDRQRVVVVFTDGYPAPYGTDDFMYSMANNAIKNAYTTKNTYNATVYTVGVFSTADPTADIKTNFANSDGWNGRGNNLTDVQEATAANRYMHYVSSNYKSVNSLTDDGVLSEKADPFNRGDSYYLAATDADALKNIFQQIADNVETGGATSSTLGSSAEIRDIVTEQFTFPENATDVKVYTAESNGSTFSWKESVEFDDAEIKIDPATRAITVSNFSYKDNWCGDEKTDGSVTGFHNGKKLIITFNVKAREGFLGGNDVLTNTSAGVFESSTATTPVATFPEPTVNVPIGEVTVTAPDKNVYLLGDVTAADIKSGATVTCGDVALDLSKADDVAKPYGLDPWATEYVNITVTYTDEDDNAVTDFNNLKDDTTYTVTVTVAPKTPNPVSTQGTKAETKLNSATGKINVFKPELTYKDSEVHNGDPEPEYDTTNYVSASTVWKHKDEDTDAETTAVPANMTGEAPGLDITYTPEDSKIASGKINTTEDKIGVEVTVKIGTEDVTSHVTFHHQDCTFVENCPDLGTYEFWLHLLSTSLTIQKQFATGTTPYDANEKFVFTVTGEDGSSLKVTMKAGESVTINNLKVGSTYTVTEDTTWGWRYDSSCYDLNDKNQITLVANGNTVTLTNTLDDNKYLSGNAYADNQWNGADGKYTKDASVEATPGGNTRSAYSFFNRTASNAAAANTETAAPATEVQVTETPKKKSIFSIFFGSGNKG